MNKDEIVELIPFIKDWVRFVGYRYKVPGISVAIQFKDELLLDFAVGKSNLETGSKLTTDTLFRIASHSKVFTTTAIMELYAEDELSLDDKISKHIPWFTENDDIRIKHILTHSSGMSRDKEYGQWHTHNFPNEEEQY